MPLVLLIIDVMPNSAFSKVELAISLKLTVLSKLLALPPAGAASTEADSLTKNTTRG
jgi:hypothetical protein